LDGKSTSGDPHSLILSAASAHLDSEQVQEVNDALEKNDLTGSPKTLLEYVKTKLKEEND